MRWWQRLREAVYNALTTVVRYAPIVDAGPDLPLGRITWRQALGLHTVWRAVSLISTDVAKLPVHLYRRTSTGRERVDDIRHVQVLRRPNPATSEFTLRRTATAHALLLGDAWIWIVRGSRKQPVKLVLLPPESVSPQQDDMGDLYWRVAGVDELIRDDDVIHITGLSWDGVTGLRPIDILADVLELEREQIRHALAFFSRGVFSSGYLYSPLALDQEQQQRLRESFMRAYAGPEGRHRVPVLVGGIEWRSMGIDPSKAQLVESRELGVRAIATMFGLPPHLLGDPARTSYASLEAENESYLTTVLDGWLVAWETELSRKLVPGDDHYWEHNRNAIVRLSYAERVAGYAKLIGVGVLSPNEVRQRENLPPRDGGDSYYVPANWQSL